MGKEVRIPYIKETSGFREASEVFGERLVRNPEELMGRSVFLGDGSTSVANLRGIEVAVVLIAAKVLGPLVPQIRTFVVGGGTTEWAAKGLGVDIGNYQVNEKVMEGLKGLFPDVIFDEKNKWFLPPQAMRGERGSLREEIVTARREVLTRGGEILGISTSNVRIFPLEDQRAVQELRVG